MSICYYCHWGWPKSVAEIYQKACVMLDDPGGYVLHGGPSHAVWEDENFETHNTQWALDHFDEYWDSDWPDSDKAIVKWSLLALQNLSDEDKDGVPEDYDDENPQDFPPTCEMVKV